MFTFNFHPFKFLPHFTRVPVWNELLGHSESAANTVCQDCKSFVQSGGTGKESFRFVCRSIQLPRLYRLLSKSRRGTEVRSLLVPFIVSMQYMRFGGL